MFPHRAFGDRLWPNPYAQSLILLDFLWPPPCASPIFSPSSHSPSPQMAHTCRQRVVCGVCQFVGQLFILYSMCMCVRARVYEDIYLYMHAGVS